MLRLASEYKYFPVKLPLLGVCIFVEIVIHGGSVEIMAIRNIYRGYIAFSLYTVYIRRPNHSITDCYD
jgi:hypothetical protein